MQSVYGPESKRQKTETEKTAEAEEKAAKQLALQSTDPTEIWELGQRQPWADKQVKPAKPTEEQLAWLKEEGFIEEPEEGAEKVIHWLLSAVISNLQALWFWFLDQDCTFTFLVRSRAWFTDLYTKDQEYLRLS